MEFGRLHRSPEEYAAGIDKMLMFLGRYGRQDATAMLDVPTVTLKAWANQLGEFLAEERRQVEERK